MLHITSQRCLLVYSCSMCMFFFRNGFLLLARAFRRVALRTGLQLVIRTLVDVLILEARQRQVLFIHRVALAVGVVVLAAALFVVIQLGFRSRRRRRGGFRRRGRRYVRVGRRRRLLNQNARGTANPDQSSIRCLREAPARHIHRCAFLRCN